MVKISEYDYGLDRDLIALHPSKVRGFSKLLSVDRSSNFFSYGHYTDFTNLPAKGDVVVLNDTRVIPARLYTHSQKRKKYELLLLEKHDSQNFYHNALIKNSSSISNGDRLQLSKVVDVIIVKRKEEGVFHIEFEKSGKLIRDPEQIHQIISELGHTPYPPYIKREEEGDDKNRYQTVFANDAGSVAAPTASLNMTKEMIEKMKMRGVHVAYVTLHVGYGTFIPLRTDDPHKHTMHSEWFSLSQENADIINNAKKVWAVGSTVTRALEHIYRIINAKKAGNMRESKKVKGMTGEANIFITPGHSFKVIDFLLTNFHAPDSTVLLMVAAFMTDYFLKQGVSKTDAVEKGRRLLLKSYNEAKSKGFKFLSYGDSMVII